MEKQVNAGTFYRFMANIYRIKLILYDGTGNLIERYASIPDSAEFLLSFSNLKQRIFGKLQAALGSAFVGFVLGLSGMTPLCTKTRPTFLLRCSAA